MSEYQYYEFLAIDKPLTDAQRAKLRKLSSRAEITSTRFTNEYSFGDFVSIHGGAVNSCQPTASSAGGSQGLPAPLGQVGVDGVAGHRRRSSCSVLAI